MNTPLRRIAVELPALAIAGWLLAGCDVTINGMGGDRYVERDKKDFQVTGTPDVVLATFDGAIEVRAWDRAEVSVEIEKRGPDKEAIDRMKVTATQSGSRVIVEVKDPDEGRAHIGFRAAHTARLIASVPRQANLEVRSGDGKVTIERVAGRMQVNTGDGSVNLTDVVGNISVRTGDGTVVFDRVEGRVDAETGDGSVTLDGKLEAVHLKTGDGTVRVRAASGSRMGEDWEIRTGDGSVGVQLPDAFDVELDAHTNDGRVHLTDFTVSGEVSHQTVRGKLGAGGRTLVVRTGDGPISISKS